jgi:hypothetical protein
MRSEKSLARQFKAKLLELETLFETVVSQKGDTVLSEFVVCKNDSLIVRIGKDYWACPLSPKECNFLQALLLNGGKMDGNNTKQWIDPPDDESIRNFVKSIRRKLAAKKMPVRISFARWIISIERTPF